MVSSTTTTDAVVIGAGPNGLVAANLLADAGWSVTVLEVAPVPGGAVRSASVTAQGYVNDLYSAFYPLGAASSVLARFNLPAFGLRWSHAPSVVGSTFGERDAIVLHRDISRTAGLLDERRRGDGAAWAALMERFETLREPLLGALLSPMPPIRDGARLAARLGPTGLRELVRLGLLSVRRLGEEWFDGSEAPTLLLGGLALHTDLTPDAATGGFFGWLLAGLGHSVGFPVPRGGAQSLTDALVARAVARGVTVRCNHEVTSIQIDNAGRAVGAAGPWGSVRARRAVLADVSAPKLWGQLVDPDHAGLVGAAVRHRYQAGSATVKVDWAIDRPIPWQADELRNCGTVHVAHSMDELTRYAADLESRRTPPDPLLIVGQMTTADPSRSPAGTESAWAYTHVPAQPHDAACWDPGSVASVVQRIEQRIEACAPGFLAGVVARHVAGPLELEAANPNLAGGDVGGGTAQLHQQLVFRPGAGWGRAGTHIERLYLASASAHPGGGVHGACGANAARAALARHRMRLRR